MSSDVLKRLTWYEHAWSYQGIRSGSVLDFVSPCRSSLVRSPHNLAISKELVLSLKKDGNIL